MIEYRIGDIFLQSDLTHIVHQCNIYHNFGAGIAKQIKEQFPEACTADCQTKRGDLKKLGTVSAAITPTGLTVINLYSQEGMGRNQIRFTRYDAMVQGFEYIRSKLLQNDILGIPYGIGCGLANGSWNIVGAIIADVFGDAKFQTVVVRLPGE